MTIIKKTNILSNAAQDKTSWMQSVLPKLDIKHKIFIIKANLKSVVDNFVESYLNGETPIPCVQCNKTVKFNVFPSQKI